MSDPNDNRTTFDDFMSGYWNQMATELYADFNAALADFMSTEGQTRYQSLVSELLALQEKGQFLPLSEIKRSYKDAFWFDYDRIVTTEDIASCASLLKLESSKK